MGLVTASSCYNANSWPLTSVNYDFSGINLPANYKVHKVNTPRKFLKLETVFLKSLKIDSRSYLLPKAC